MAAPTKLMRTVYPTTTGTGSGSGTTGASSPYSIGCTFDGNLPPNYVLALIPLDVSVTYAALLAPSQGYLQFATTALLIIGIFSNGVSIGTMVFAAGAQVATFTGGSVVCPAGSVITVVTPMSIDATANTIGFILSGART